MYDLSNVVDRLVAMETEALSSIAGVGNVDAATYWPYEQQAFPYWWNRVVNMTVRAGEATLAADIDIHEYTFQAGLVIGHIDSGYSGERVAEAYNYIEAVVAYFNDHRDLTDTTTFTTAPDFLWHAPGYGAHITSIPGGIAVRQESGIEAVQHVLVFQIEVPLLFEVNY